MRLWTFWTLAAIAGLLAAKTTTTPLAVVAAGDGTTCTLSKVAGTRIVFTITCASASLTFAPAAVTSSEDFYRRLKAG